MKTYRFQVIWGLEVGVANRAHVTEVVKAFQVVLQLSARREIWWFGWGAEGAAGMVRGIGEVWLSWMLADIFGTMRWQKGSWNAVRESSRCRRRGRSNCKCSCWRSCRGTYSILSSRLGSLRFEVATAIAPSNLPAQFLRQRAMLPPLSVSLRLEILNQTGSKFGIWTQPKVNQRKVQQSGGTAKESPSQVEHHWYLHEYCTCTQYERDCTSPIHIIGRWAFLFLFWFLILDFSK